MGDWKSLSVVQEESSPDRESIGEAEAFCAFATNSVF